MKLILIGKDRNMTSLPTIFHITHHKAGSQWVAEVLKYCAPVRIVLPKQDVAHFYRDPLQPGKVYLTVYVPKSDFDAVITSFDAVCLPFVVIRDLRDTLVSLYFSLKVSHALLSEEYHRWRKELRKRDREQGLLYLMGERLFLSALSIQKSWVNADALLVKYEDLLSDEHAVFENIFDYCEIDVDRRHLHEIVDKNSFETVTGRQPGQEDVTAHQRKGIAGDWQNYFTDRVKDIFKQRFSDVLIQTGYEQGLNW